MHLAGSLIKYDLGPKNNSWRMEISEENTRQYKSQRGEIDFCPLALHQYQLISFIMITSIALLYTQTPQGNSPVVLFQSVVHVTLIANY